MITPSTPLQKRVARWLKDQGKEYSDGPQGAYDDLMQGGCQSGIVSELIYTRECVKFYRKYQREIDGLLHELCQDTGESPAALFARSGWDDEDPLAREDMNQNILAWFGFEETARSLME